jgi:prepilin-type N-terminal cleavage/methylation domain-containing protein
MLTITPPLRRKIPPGVGIAPAGFTLVEVLVTIGVIGLLTAISLPAIQASREASRRTVCTSHIRQLAIATQNHASTYGAYPEFSPLERLLPFVEAQKPTSDTGVQVELYQCPAESHPEWGNPWSASYYFNDGSHIYFKPGGKERSNGVAFDFAGVRPRDVTDGESNTAMYSERQLTPFQEDLATREEVAALYRRYPTRCVWRLGLTFVYGEEDAFLSACGDSALRRPLRDITPSHGYISIENTLFYKHVLPPNSPGCEYFMPPRPHPAWIIGEWDMPANSGHPGGVNLSLCDGATKFVADGIDVHVWRAVGTRNGGDVIGPY